MREWIRQLSFRGEFAIVLCGAFGLPLVDSIPALWTPERWLQSAPPFTNAHLLETLIIELVVGSLLWQFLFLRGWTFARIGLAPVRPTRREFLMTPLVGLGLWLATYLGFAILVYAAFKVSPEFVWQASRRPLVAPGLPMSTMLAVAVINPIFEEVFVCGYVVSSLRDRLGVASAVNVSAGIRVAYHLYQGPIGVLSITPFALVAAIWFARTNRLAPLVIAHGLQDFIGLALASWSLSH